MAPPQSSTAGSKVKLVLVGLVALALIAFVLSNWDAPELSFLGIVKLRVPLGLLVLGTAAGGFAIGWTAKALRARRHAASSRV